ncbi:MAG TPA: glycosyltransferase family 4 protein [Acidimicrobiales bacterium]|nr:glycosyltransferase family 4 protein [Acidimicrobiales bacterium]
MGGENEHNIVWLLREHPDAAATGHSRWVHSLLRSASVPGVVNHVALPDARGLPSWWPADRSGWVVHAPHIRDVRGIRLAPPRVVARNVAWRGYHAAPLAVQRQLAAARRAARRRRAVDHVLGRSWSSAERAWIEGVMTREQPDIVVFDSVFTLDGVDTSARRVVLVSDLVHERAASFAELGYRTAPKGLTPEWELGLLAGADALVTIQWDDADLLRAQLPGMPVTVAPPTFAPVARRAAPDPGTCLFVGIGTLHNVDALRWTLESVWGTVRRVVPGAELRVAGSVGGQVPVADPSVTILGRVADLGAEYARAAVVIVPLRAGSGLKVKVAEAISHGCAIVTTPVGAQGLMALEPRPFVVADGSEAFSGALISLLRDGDARAALETAAASAQSVFDPAKAHADLLPVITGAVR